MNDFIITRPCLHCSMIYSVEELSPDEHKTMDSGGPCPSDICIGRVLKPKPKPSFRALEFYHSLNPEQQKQFKLVAKFTETDADHLLIAQFLEWLNMPGTLGRTDKSLAIMFCPSQSMNLIKGFFEWMAVER